MVDVSEELIASLKKKAVTLRKHIIRMTHNAQSGHPGGSMSAADIVTALYFHVLRVDPKNPTWPDRDRFVLSKGHACPVWYAALAERGFFPVEELLTFRKLNSRLQGHPELGTTPGVENAAGTKGRPTAVISRTVKGKGVSFMENKIKYHGAATSDDELKLALAELDAQEAAI